MTTKHGQFEFFVKRDFSDQEICVHCDVVDIDPPDPAVGLYGYRVTIGDTWDDAGKSFDLTPLELETAERQAAEALLSGIKEAE